MSPAQSSCAHQQPPHAFDWRAFDRGKGYRYPHDEEGAYAAGEHYLPDGMRAETWYRPTRHGVEAKIADKLADLRERDRAAGAASSRRKDDPQR